MLNYKTAWAEAQGLQLKILKTKHLREIKEQKAHPFNRKAKGSFSRVTTSQVRYLSPLPYPSKDIRLKKNLEKAVNVRTCTVTSNLTADAEQQL